MRVDEINEIVFGCCDDYGVRGAEVGMQVSILMYLYVWTV